jgi:lycopene beta-cyclase
VDADYALVGGGLQNGLSALALEAARPAARIVMIERGNAPGGNHTWCFHAGDLATIARPPSDSAADAVVRAHMVAATNARSAADIPAWIERLIVARWDGYDVAFPAYSRTLASPYACVSSDRFAGEVTLSLRRPGCRLLTHATAIEVDAHRVLVRHADNTLEEIRAHVVIDARGPEATRQARATNDARGANDVRANDAPSGWQKFLGQELRLDAPHGLARPMLMDATVAQIDATVPERAGFRFLYVLPLAPDRVLVEDTYFSDGTRIDATELRARIAAYVARRRWRIAEVVREEVGLLPLPLRCDSPSPTTPIVAGYAGGWFHPVTGYSFPIAARLAALVASVPAEKLVGDELHASVPAEKLVGHELRAMAAAQAKQMSFALLLNRMLFGWFPPAQRFRVLERFYRLPESLVRRFYALELTALDKARILVGRPPRGMSIRAALGLEDHDAAKQFAREAP